MRCCPPDNTVLPARQHHFRRALRCHQPTLSVQPSAGDVSDGQEDAHTVNCGRIGVVPRATSTLFLSILSLL